MTSLQNASMTLRRKYINPPLQEALCEFRFETGKKWDWTIPGLVYDRIREQFPLKQQANSLEVSLEPKEGAIHQELKGTISRMQFLRNDKSSMVQIGPDLLAINVLPPYPGWEQFFAMIGQNLEVYKAVAEPKGVTRIGLRYINRMQLASKEVELTEFFNFYPQIPKTIEQRHGPFSIGVLFAYSTGRDSLHVRMGTAPNDGSENVAIALDLDYYLAQREQVSLNQAMEWVREAHENLESMFEACITDKLRETLNGQEGKA